MYFWVFKSVLYSSTFILNTFVIFVFCYRTNASCQTKLYIFYHHTSVSCQTKRYNFYHHTNASYQRKQCFLLWYKIYIQKIYFQAGFWVARKVSNERSNKKVELLSVKSAGFTCSVFEITQDHLDSFPVSPEVLLDVKVVI